MQSQPTTFLCLYRYDPLDRLTSHTLSQTPECHRFYCKSRLTTEIQGAMKYSIVQHGDLLLAQQRVEGEALDTTLLVNDQQRSVVQTLKANLPLQSIAYSPFGHRRPECGLVSLLGFNGERPDPVTGHYLLGNGYRAFNPMLMRFNSPDSLSPFGEGGLNVYAYCSNDPVNRVDPTGQWAIFTLLGSIPAAMVSVSGFTLNAFSTGSRMGTMLGGAGVAAGLTAGVYPFSAAGPLLVGGGLVAGYKSIKTGLKVFSDQRTIRKLSKLAQGNMANSRPGVPQLADLASRAIRPGDLPKTTGLELPAAVRDTLNKGPQSDDFLTKFSASNQKETFLQEVRSGKTNYDPALLSEEIRGIVYK